MFAILVIIAVGVLVAPYAWAEVTAVTAAVAATAVTSPTGGIDEALQIVDLLGSGQGVLAAAVAVNLLIAFMRNSNKYPALKALQLDKLIGLIPSAYIPLVAAVLGGLGMVLTAVSQGQPWSTALIQGVAGGLGATGIHEAAKPITRRGKTDE